jgi:outer membrane protein TolC
MFDSKDFSIVRLLSLISAGLLSACAVGPDFKQPDAPNTSTYTETTLSKKLTTAPGVPGGTSQEFIEGGDIEAQWWELFKSPELDILIKKALQLRCARAKKMSAHKLVGNTSQPLV